MMQTLAQRSKSQSIALLLSSHCLLIAIPSLTAHANVIQLFTGISYSNPAELCLVENNEAIIGGITHTFTNRFRGRSLNRNTQSYDQGINYTKTISLLPYGRIAKRYNEQLVFGVDVTQPYHTNHNWGSDAFTRYAMTQKYVIDVDVSPRFSFKANNFLAVGAGINLNFLNNYELDFSIPSGQTSYANVVNSAAGYGTGFNAGVYLSLTPNNAVGITYYSRIYQKTRGVSRWDQDINDSLRFNLTLPATTVMNYIHQFSPKLRSNLEFFYAEWSANKTFHIMNSAIPPPLGPHIFGRLDFKNSMAVRATMRHQTTERLALSLVGLLDKGPERAPNRSLGILSGDTYVVGATVDYQFTKSTQFKLTYGFSMLNTIINDKTRLGTRIVPLSVGNLNAYGNIIDISFRVKG